MNMLVNVDNIKPQFKELKRSHEESVKTSKLKGPLSAGKTYWIKTSGLFGKELIVFVLNVSLICPLKFALVPNLKVSLVLRTRDHFKFYPCKQGYILSLWRWV